jgi:hypothetical protein
LIARPETAESTFYGTPAFKVGKQWICRLWSQREHDRDDVHDTEVLVVRCDLDEKAALVDAFGGVLFSTPHYDGHPAMVVRLADADDDLLIDVLDGSYRLAAPPALLRLPDDTTD